MKQVTRHTQDDQRLAAVIHKVGRSLRARLCESVVVLFALKGSIGIAFCAVYLSASVNERQHKEQQHYELHSPHGTE